MVEKTCENKIVSCVCCSVRTVVIVVVVCVWCVVTLRAAEFCVCVLCYVRDFYAARSTAVNS
jgi:hypothetical protein